MCVVFLSSWQDFLLMMSSVKTQAGSSNTSKRHVSLCSTYLSLLPITIQAPLNKYKEKISIQYHIFFQTCNYCYIWYCLKTEVECMWARWYFAADVKTLLLNSGQIHCFFSFIIYFFFACFIKLAHLSVVHIWSALR